MKNIKQLRKVKDYVSQKFGRLMVLSESDRQIAPNGKSRRMALCVCDCGKEKVIRISSLLSGNTVSCGCKRKESMTTHGMTQNAEYRAWKAMKDRCYNENHKQFKDWGGRGIKVCDRWINSFENFHEDMKEKPTKKHSLDRIDNNKGYLKENCRWATKKQQSENRRGNRILEFNGELHTMTEWARRVGMNFGKLRGRLNLGWSTEKALTIK